SSIFERLFWLLIPRGASHAPRCMRLVGDHNRGGERQIGNQPPPDIQAVRYMRYNPRMLTPIPPRGNSFVIRVPREEMDRIGIAEGEPVSVEIRSVDVRPRLPRDLRRIVGTEIAMSASAFQRLADA